MPKAILCKVLGPPESLVFEDVPTPAPQDGECVIDVAYSSANFPDTLIIEGKYQSKPDLPFSPGSEMSGVVRAVGPNVKLFKVGDHVAAGLGWGSFREQVVVHESRLLQVPKGLDLITASAFMMTYGTTYHAFKQRAKLQAGEVVLVLGAAGGTGLAAVDLAKAMGATVIACASTDEKLKICKKYGADFVINYATEDLRAKIKEFAKGKGVDVIYDPVGDKYAVPAIRSLAWEGRYLVIGFAGGAIPKLPLNLLLLKGAAAVGVFWGAFTMTDPAANNQNTIEIVSMITAGKIKPLVTQTYPLERAADALNDLMSRKVLGKAVVVINPPSPAAKL